MNDELRTILADTLGIDAFKITDDASADTIQEWDSVAHINVVLSLESRYGVSFTPEEILQLNTVQNIKQLLHQRGVAGY